MPVMTTVRPSVLGTPQFIRPQVTVTASQYWGLSFLLVLLCVSGSSHREGNFHLCMLSNLQTLFNRKNDEHKTVTEQECSAVSLNGRYRKQSCLLNHDLSAKKCL